jgi:glycine cleavage system H protein
MMTKEILVANKYIIKADRLYTEKHEWVKKNGECWLYGITSYATIELGEISHIAFHAVGGSFSQDETILNIETLNIKADSYAPFDCRIIEINEDLEVNPIKVFNDPYGEGWLVKLECRGTVEGLLSPEEYANLVKAEATDL